MDQMGSGARTKLKAIEQDHSSTPQRPYIRYEPDLAVVLESDRMALLVSHISFLLSLKGSGKDFDGHHWVYVCTGDLREIFPTWSPRSLTRWVTLGVQKGVIVTARRNGYPTFYRIDFQRLRDLYEQKGMAAPDWIPAYEDLLDPPDAIQLGMQAEADIIEASREPLAKMASATRQIGECHSPNWPVPLAKLASRTLQREQQKEPHTERIKLASSPGLKEELVAPEPSAFLDELAYQFDLPPDASEFRIIAALERDLGESWNPRWAPVLADEASADRIRKPLAFLAWEIRRLIRAGVNLEEDPPDPSEIYARKREEPGLF